MINWTILKLIEWTTEYFTKAGIPNPRLDAELLLAHTINKKRIELYLSFDQIVGEKDLATFKGFIQRRAKREPLQYIIGVQDFCGVLIKVTPDVLVPRPETELLVEEAFKRLNDDRKPTTDSSGATDKRLTILDLCTGSGAIIAALASKLPDAHFVGTDISAAALEIARQNTEVWKDRIELLCGDLFAPLVGEPLCGLPKREGTEPLPYFDIITSNPPYIPESEWPSLQPEIRNHEPKMALIAEEDGLAIISKIINTAHEFLKPGGWLIMEIGDGQSEAVRKLIADAGHYNEPEFVKDYGGIERIIIINPKL